MHRRLGDIEDYRYRPKKLGKHRKLVGIRALTILGDITDA